jgi:hypothetical protein
MPAPDSIKRLVDTFASHLSHYKSTGYNETEVRREFLDPFFKALGWDIDNESGYADAYKDVIHEDAIKVGGYTKAPDYCFRIGGQRKFFLEAKKPSVNIKSDIAPAFQLRRYAWSAKLPLSILSDFEELAVYDCRIKPGKNDNAAKARTLYFTFDQYVEKWDEIASIFSREAVLKGSFDKYAESSKKKRGTAEVDDAFLAEIERWRELLARNFALRNPHLSIRDLNFAVQKTIDRLIFLRICEDRGTEDYGRLQGIINGANTYERLLELFTRADDRYNSGLFHFTNETGRPGAPDNLTPGLTLDDKVLKDILRNFYYPDSPYEFSVLPADILGQVYEQFLGKTIRLTAGHQAKIEEKPEVRKAGGVYYTPKYIVDYIVENTLGRLLNGADPKNPKPIAVSRAAKLKVLDPACGSGSFLIVAYQYLLDWHRDQYTTSADGGEADEGKIKRHAGGKDPKIYQARGGEYRLTTNERKRILLNNIHGVDIDSQAVEVTKLSLLLKVLEGETQQNLQRDFIQERERILPDLGNNIKCGNSLIGSDFYESKQLDVFNDEEVYRINAFDWETEFPEVLKAGGFSTVLGNPPYVDIKGYPKEERDYIFATYQCANNRINLFSTFLEKSLGLMRSDYGNFSMIVPTAILAQSSYQELRKKILSETSIASLARLPNESFGSVAGKVKVDTVIVTVSKPRLANKKFEIIAYRGYERINRIVPESAHISGSQTTEAISQPPDYVWSVNTTSEQANLLRKMEQVGEPLNEFVEFCLGLTPYDKYKGHSPEQIEQKVFHSDHKKGPTYRKLLRGNDVRRYSLSWNACHWISYGPWLGAPRDQRFFTEKRILVKQIIDWSSLRIWATLTDQELYNTQNAFNLLQKGKEDLSYLLGLLNSRLLNFYHAKKYLDEFKMRFQKILIKDCKRFPIRSIDFNCLSDSNRHKHMVDLVTKMSNLCDKIAKEKNPETLRHSKTQISILDRQIDKLVYDLYGLTEEEIALVESSV